VVIPTFCPICFAGADERDDIDKAIRANRESFDSIASRIGVSRRVVRRHRDHLAEAPKREPNTVVIAPIYNINLVVSPSTEEAVLEGDPDQDRSEELLGHA
jgi:hypothetical protein